jgi:DNA-binding MarR family transcriptional regulator
VPVHDQPSPSPWPAGDGASHRLGFLLKHAELRYAQLTSAALEPVGISPREWATLSCLDEQAGRSQREVADLLGVDRTTMVALVDQLQAKGLVRRQSQAGDRRKNAVELTSAGRDARRRGAGILDDCERTFLAVLGGTGADQLKNALYAALKACR